jgi:hypothetical protein
VISVGRTGVLSPEKFQPCMKLLAKDNDQDHSENEEGSKRNTYSDADLVFG